MIGQDDIVAGRAVRKPPDAFAAADVFGLVLTRGIDMDGEGMADAHDHCYSIEINLAGCTVTENKRAVCTDELRSGISDGGGHVNGLYLLRLNDDRKEGSLGAIGGAENGGNCKELADLVVAKLDRKSVV